MHSFGAQYIDFFLTSPRVSTHRAVRAHHTMAWHIKKYIFIKRIAHRAAGARRLNRLSNLRVGRHIATRNFFNFTVHAKTKLGKILAVIGR